MITRWYFKAWSKSQGRFLSEEEAALAGVWLGFGGHLEHHPDLILRHYTGLLDMNKEMLYEGDVVEFDQITEFGLVKRRGFMRWIATAYSISMNGDPQQQGTQYATQNVRKIGTMLEHPDLARQDPVVA